MTLTEIISLIYGPFWIATCAWFAADFAWSVGRREDVVQATLWLLKWPALAGILVSWLDAVLSGRNPAVNAAATVWMLWVWWRHRNDGDDDWRKRKREALGARVHSIGHRLVVVPEGGAA